MIEEGTKAEIGPELKTDSEGHFIDQDLSIDKISVEEISGDEISEDEAISAEETEESSGIKISLTGIEVGIGSFHEI